MMHASDDNIIDLLNNGSVSFTRISQFENKLPSLDQLYVRITLRTGNQESTRDLYLKGQVLIADNQGAESHTVEISPESSILTINEQPPHEQKEQNNEECLRFSLASAGESINGSNDEAKRHRCISCNKDFRYRNLITHITASGHGLGIYKCICCDKNFTSIRQFKYHMHKTHKRKPDRIYTSFTIDNEAFAKKDQDVDNIKFPKADNLYECITCDSTFGRKRTYTRHLKFQICKPGTKKRPFKCKMCNKCFSKRVFLKSHICEPSGKKLDGHKVIHTEEMPFKYKLFDKSSLYNQCPNNQYLDSNSHRRLPHEKSLSGSVSHSMIQTTADLKYVDRVDPEYLCEPKLEVQDEDEEFWFTEPNIHIKQELDS